ncbi:hypothetical protein A2690_03785 [Candidatus Roizmanbacteria bacterium RIFCSPHIGHO2_01_FULL_39_12b]|uniref:cysteine desulfurase n=1 Tax=Candidatus Roizmanbacteria bacterium RIFCSPHIGHO2_01_FULL_39_12b TaxID=1802030 RepID=A0A1F7GCY9_9BACT|nr:MAG: hypothetical protein A2690_03785 [Candidatus Roizmanbacteria bacterium RIFCSPHIGHO2_01_FULL_39_12b]OGK47062.1 MAG: hypothetical protein A3B46_01510 [Candidatus Roizmanbacteria bacterium RIFCSPLOWO2_01_FULL_39_19]
MSSQLDPFKIKVDFPVFKNNPEIIYLDSSATQLKPQSVIDKIVEYYSVYPSNIHRGIYKIADTASEEYENSREIVAKFIGADTDEVIFTKSTTESLNLLAYSLVNNLSTNDEVVVSVMEHHANFVPWQQIAKQKGVQFKIIDITNDGDLDLGDNFEKIEEYISKNTKIVCLTYVSNVLGIINPIKKIVDAIRRINNEIIIVIDGAQAVAHLKIDVKTLDADFIAFSGHKIVGPTGVGVLWGKKSRLEELPPFLYGGDMIEKVSIGETLFKHSPYKFEAGTPPIASAIAMGASIKFVQTFDFEDIYKHEEELYKYTVRSIKENLGDFVTILGENSKSLKIGIVSFCMRNVHPHDVAQVASDFNVALRAGHHCAMPLHERLNVPASARASFYIYNTKQDVNKLIESLQQVKKLFS